MKNFQKIGNRLFRYRNGLVEYVQKADKGMIEEDKKWQERYGYPLFGVDKDGYVVLDTASLSREHWDDKETRIEYLTEWDREIEEEVAYMVDDFGQEMLVWQ